MPKRNTVITTAHLDAIYARSEYDLVYFDINSPNGKHRHPQALIRRSAERLLAEGYKLRLQRGNLHLQQQGLRRHALAGHRDRHRRINESRPGVERLFI